MKKFLSSVVSVVMLLSVVGCGTRNVEQHSNSGILNTDALYPILKEEYKDIKLDLMGWCRGDQNDDWENMLFWKEMKNLTGVDFNFDVVDEGSWYDRMSLSFTTEEVMPDVLFRAHLTPADEIKLSKDGSIIPLDDLIEKYAPNFNKLLNEDPMLRKNIMSNDGKIYSLPTVYEQGLTHYNQAGIYINHVWLQRVGKEMPSTTDELLDVLRAFKKVDFNGNGKNDEIPLQISSLYDFKLLLSEFGLNMMDYYVMVQNDNVVFGPETNNFKEGLKFFRTLYQEGLINVNYVTEPYAQKVMVASASDCVGMLIDASPSLRVGNTRYQDFSMLIPLTSNVHSTPIYPGQQGVERGCFAITRCCEYPELAIRWIDTLYSPDYNVLCDIGREGIEWEWDNEEHTSWSYLKDEETMADMRLNEFIQWGGGLPYLAHGYTEFWDKQSDPIETHNQIEKNKVMDYLVPSYFPISFTSQVQTQVNLIYNDMATYVDNIMVDTICGKIDIEQQWDSILKQYDKLDKETYIEILQREYNRWKAL